MHADRNRTDLRDVLADVRSDGRSRSIRCLAHEDLHPSLSVSQGDDGRTLLHCHAGCPTEDVLRAAGLTWGDLHGETPGDTRPRIVDTYRYRAADGTHLFDVVRYEPKGFCQRRADGVWSMQGVRRVLYRLPEIQGQSVVYIVEGERDADRLAAIGLAATTAPGGAGKWRAEYTEQLRQAGVQHVVILPDNDEPGRSHAAAVARSCRAAGLTVTVTELRGLPTKGDVSDWLDAGHTRADLEALVIVGAIPEWLDAHRAGKDALAAALNDGAVPSVAPKAAAPAAALPQSAPSDDRRARQSQAAELVDLALAADVELWHTPAGEAYGTVQVRGHREHYPLRRVVRDYLAHAYYVETGRAASSQALTDTLVTLGGMARYDGAEHPVAVRLATYEDRIYLDLGDSDHRKVEIDASGWRIVADAPVRHWRPASLRPLPVPTPGCSLDSLRELWPQVDDDAWTLLVSFLVSSMAPAGPYPALILTGEQGSGKSTVGRQARGLIDPAAPELRGVPRDERDVMIGALTSHIVALDNLSGLPAWLSDALCRIATGGGLATRTLFSDLDETLIDVTRPILLTGIDSPATRGDLLDRAFVVTLPAMRDEDRADERGLWARYRAMRPGLLGALLDAVSMALRCHGDVHLIRRPRMADACTWVTAAEPALGWQAGRTVETWMCSRAAASADLIGMDPVAQALLALTDETWRGNATELLALMVPQVSERTLRSRSWPSSPKALAGALRRLAPDLRRSGVDIDLPVGARTARERIITIRRGRSGQDTQDTQDRHHDSPNDSGTSARPVSCPIEDFDEEQDNRQDADSRNESGALSDLSGPSCPPQPRQDVARGRF